MNPERIKYWKGRALESPNGLPNIYVGRPGPWGNQFVIKEIKSASGREWYVVNRNVRLQAHNKISARACAVRLYREWIWDTKDAAYRNKVRRELRGKNLGCWCALDGGPCHGDVLLQVAASMEEDETQC